MLALVKMMRMHSLKYLQGLPSHAVAIAEEFLLEKRREVRKIVQDRRTGMIISETNSTWMHWG